MISIFLNANFDFFGEKKSIYSKKLIIFGTQLKLKRAKFTQFTNTLKYLKELKMHLHIAIVNYHLQTHVCNFICPFRILFSMCKESLASSSQLVKLQF